MSDSSGQVTLVYAPIDAPEVEYSVQGGSVDEVVAQMFNAWSLHGDIVVQPFEQDGAILPNITQIFAEALNNTFDDIDATWNETGQIVIRGV